MSIGLNFNTNGPISGLLGPIATAGNAVINAVTKKQSNPISGLLGPAATVGNAVINSTKAPAQNTASAASNNLYSDPYYSPSAAKPVHPAAPSTPPVSHTVTTPDGTTITQKYATALPPDDPSNKYNTQTGQLNPKYNGGSSRGSSGGSITNSGTNLPLNTSGVNQNDQNALTPQQIAQQTGQTVQDNNQTNNQTTSTTDAPTAYGENLASLTNYGQGNESPQVTQARQRLQDLENEYRQKFNLIQKNGGDLSLANGEEGLLQNQYLTAKDAATQALQNAISSQGQQITAAQQGASLSTPSQSTQQVAPGNAVLNSQGKEIYSGIGGLTNLGIAQQNIRQGQSYQQQAADLANTLNTINGTSDQVLTLAQNTGITWTNSPAANKAAFSYFQQQNPTAATSYMAGIGELENQISNIIASQTGETPSAVTQTLDSYDFKYLSPDQLKGFLGNMNEFGKTRLQALQNSQNSSYSANSSGVTPYSGATATPGLLNTGTQVSPLEAGAGTALGATENTISGLLNHLGGVLGGAAVTKFAEMFGL